MWVACAVFFGAAGVSGTTTEPRTERVSLNSAGVQGNNQSTDPAISADGRYVAFISAASNLVPDDTNVAVDVFVRDRQSGITERVSVNSSGVQGNAHSGFNGSRLATGIAISADGRSVAFFSDASNLVPDDTNSASDVFVHDRITGQTERVSVGANGQGNASSGYFTVALSGDGSIVAFDSFASNLVDGDTTNAFFGLDVFVRDRSTAQTQRISVSSTGAEANHGNGYVAISSDGRFVAFTTAASNLVAGDTNGALDVVVFDRQSQTLELVSLANDGAQGNFNSGVGSDFHGVPVSISADGGLVAFVSAASNLVPGDSNGFVDVFVRDRASGTTERVNIGNGGEQAQFGSFGVAISADGRFVAFDGNLVGGNVRSHDVFVRDRNSGTTELLSVNNVDEMSVAPAISADGRFVAFWSHSATLVEGDTNFSADVFVRDRGGVADTEPPALNLPAEISVDAASPAGATVTYFASAIDNIDGPVAVTCSPESGSIFAVGTTSVTCSATDAAGNTARARFVVTVRPFFSPFAAFQAEIEIEPDEVTLKALLHLGATSDGIQPGTEAVTVQLGAFTVTFPAGSFTDDGHGRWRVRAEAGEPALDARIRPEAGGFEFRVDLPRHLAASFGPSVEVSLTIGNDRGVTTALVDTN